MEPMMRILTIALAGLVLVHESISESHRTNKGLGATLKITKSETLPEKLKQYLGPAAEKDIMVKMNDIKWPQSVPKEFDLRKEHPECADLFSQAQDEGACDTDAPAIVSSILADKYCIQTGGKKKEQFSADFLVRCAEKCRETAWIAMSWIWAWNYGVPTGGDYNSDIGCQPYSYKPCKHTLEKYIAKKKRVMSSESDAGRKDGLEECRHAYSKVKQNKCTVKCTNTNYEYKDMKNRTVRFQDWYFLPENDEEAMKKEIIARGSIAVGFTLYDDFFKYKKGIYRVSKGAEEAATWKHAKVIGWGEEKGQKYWLAVNTWSNFNGGNKIIKFGIDQANIQEYVTSGHLFEDVHPDDENDDSQEEYPARV